MSEQVTASYEKNHLMIDKIGSFVNIIRKTNEPVENYRNRVFKAYKELYELDNESFWRSLSYITTSGEKNIGFLTVEEDAKTSSRISISNEIISISTLGQTYEIDLSEHRFMIDLVDRLSAVNGISFSALDEEDTSWHYLYSKNLLPRKTNKIFLNKTLSSRREVSPRENSTDFTYWYERLINQPYIENNIIVSETESLQEGYIEYRDFPLLLTCSPFLALSCNKSEFKNIIKDDNGNLTQRGAKIINKILEKQNTYWGK